MLVRGDDVTRRARAEADLVDRADFLARLSHGIRSPMSAVAGLVSVLLASDPLTPDQRDYANALKLSADSVVGQIQDMLETARLQAGLKAGEIVPPPAPPELGPVVRTDTRPVLLVEDYEPNILLTTTFLESFGYGVEVAHSGLLAVEKAISGGYALALMDIQMPDIDGLESRQPDSRPRSQNGCCAPADHRRHRPFPWPATANAASPPAWTPTFQSRSAPPTCTRTSLRCCLK